MMDRRSTFGTSDLAHSSLQGEVEARSFVDGVVMRVATPSLSIQGPAATALERQALYGWPVHVLNPEEKAPLLRCQTTGYVGFLRQGSLDTWRAPTHRVAVRQTLSFDSASFKSPDPISLPLGAYVTVSDQEGRFSRTCDGRFIPTNHLKPMDHHEPDPVAVAEQHLGTAYLWGGNSSFGIDCSGLVQAALHACGLPCPGDSDQQEAILGDTLPPNTPAQRGDLFFWKGHVALAVSDTTLIHANVFHMAVAYENISDAITRIAAQGDGPVTRHARLAQLMKG
jgi:hypothetical protein